MQRHGGLLTLAHTSNLTDTYDLEVTNAGWSTTLWDATFTNQIDTVGPLTPCTQAQSGCASPFPPTPDYV
ncbi:MAG: hypothetical protein R3E31_18855 [Chloroflexota bacterium]